MTSTPTVTTLSEVRDGDLHVYQRTDGTWSDPCTRLARAAGLRPSPTGRVQVTAHVHTRTRRRMDPANAAPTTKALVDGALVDGQVVPDDDHTHLTGPDHRRGDPVPDLAPGWRAITLTITTI